jgi:choline monooxygenase
MGIIFINLSNEAPDFDEFISPLTKRWETFLGAEGLGNIEAPAGQSRLDITIQANWKLAVENYCEAYHLPWVHPSLNKYSPLNKHYNIVFAENMSGQGSYAYTLSDVAGTALPQFENWPQDQLKHAEYISLYPNVLLGLQADHAFVMVVQPISSGVTIEKLELIYVGKTALDEPFRASREAVLESWRQVFSEDIFVVEGMQKARYSPAFTGGVFSAVMDVPSHHFHQWVAEKYGAKSRESG